VSKVTTHARYLILRNKLAYFAFVAFLTKLKSTSRSASGLVVRKGNGRNKKRKKNRFKKHNSSK